MNETTTYIPASLQALPCWLLWRLEHRHGRQTKIPYRADGSGLRASSTDPETWSNYAKAAARLERELDNYSGLGFVFSNVNDIVGVDLDHCFLDGVLTEQACAALRHFQGTYAEVSQSGEGLHILCRGNIPRSFRRGAVECYHSGRFFALTGNAIQRCEVNSCQVGLDWLWETYGPRQDVGAAQVGAGCTVVADGSSRKPGGSGLSDAEIITRLQQHGRGAALWAGDWQGAGYSSRSEADAALCTILAFWADRDAARIERLFGASGLVRDKWTRRADYRQRTVAAGCAACGETLTEFKRRRQLEEAAELERLLAFG